MSKAPTELERLVLQAVADAGKPPSQSAIAFSVSERTADGLEAIEQLVQSGCLLRFRWGEAVTRLYLRDKGRAALSGEQVTSDD